MNTGMESHTLNTVTNYFTFHPMYYPIIGRASKTSLVVQKHLSFYKTILVV